MNPWLKDKCEVCGYFKNDFGECECESYEQKALLFAEKYGIFEYYTFDNKMVYEMYYRNEGRFLHIVDLDTMKEEVQKTEKAEWEK